MYWFDISALKEDLKKGPLSQKVQFMYIFFTFLFYDLLCEFISFISNDEHVGTTDFLIVLLDFLILSAGIYYAYKANGKDKGKDFMQRYLSISFVVGIRFLFILLLFLLMFFLVSIFFEETVISSNLIDYLFYAILYIWYIALTLNIIKHIKEIAADKI